MLFVEEGVVINYISLMTRKYQLIFIVFSDQLRLCYCLFWDKEKRPVLLINLLIFSLLLCCQDTRLRCKLCALGLLIDLFLLTCIIVDQSISGKKVMLKTIKQQFLIIFLILKFSLFSFFFWFQVMEDESDEKETNSP